MDNPRDNTVIIYDSECKLCNYAVKFLKAPDSPEDVKFVSSSDPAALPLMKRHNINKEKADKTVILIDGNKTFTKSEAIIRAVQRKGHLWRLAGAFYIIPEFLRNLIYDWIAKRRK